MAADLEPVAQVTAKLQALLDHLKRETTLPTSKGTAGTAGIEAQALHDALPQQYDQAYRYSVVETAARHIFYHLVSTFDIHHPDFVAVWHLLDILASCGDRGQCTAELVCWLIEELLDSQTTEGCKFVFDYLESRRERLAAKDFHKKNLIFLRSCNELLRRLSRAEDANFCGRVFFFLFHTFPLGDKSSVNLRGEFHIDNITKFEVPAAEDGMDVGEDEAFQRENAIGTPKAETPSTPQPPTAPAIKGVKAALGKPALKKTPEEVILSNSELYPIFWRLQQDFSDPTRLFGAEHFASFKKGLQATLTKFKKTPTVLQTKPAAAQHRGVKRRKVECAGPDDEMRPDGEATVEAETAKSSTEVDKYNPKYLTSRDLFDLELSDLAFQRHIMVQALILLDFLLSLTAKAKAKLAADSAAMNKSLLYSYTLSTDDEKWCLSVRKQITSYLQEVPSFGEGRFYHRVVETVLARDKNWVRWKLLSCPTIVRDPVSTTDLLSARQSARDTVKQPRLPPLGQGMAMDFSFLSSDQADGGLEALKAPARFTAPTLKDLMEGVKGDRLDLEMAMDDDETENLKTAILNKTWRALRKVRRTQLELLDKVDPSQDIESVLKTGAGDHEAEKGDETSDDGKAEIDTVLKSESEESGLLVANAPEVTVTGEHNTTTNDTSMTYDEAEATAPEKEAKGDEPINKVEAKEDPKAASEDVAGEEVPTIETTGALAS